MGLAAHGVALLRAGNPGPLTLSGTNTWLVERWVIDPGPAIDAHLDAVAAAVSARGGASGIALTHDHADHAEGVGGLQERLGGGVPVVSARGGARDGDVFGPLRVLALPGHADDHLAFVAGRAGFTGDAVLGEGSVFVSSRLGRVPRRPAGAARARPRGAVPGPRAAGVGRAGEARRLLRSSRRSASGGWWRRWRRG